MYKLIEDFPEQLAIGLHQFKSSGNDLMNKEIDHILICGMGGSGVGGLFIKSYFADKLHIPVSLINDYVLPHWVNHKTLVICSSYSGETEETLASYREAILKNAIVAVVSSGGTLIEMAVRDQAFVKPLPRGYSSPRACLGFSFFALLSILKEAGLSYKNIEDEVAEMVDFIRMETENIEAKGKALAPYLKDRKIIIYSSCRFEPAATRFKQQLNENAKALAWVSLFPEMNHNELVGWSSQNNDIVALMLRSPLDLERNQIRMNICKEIFGHFAHLIEVKARGVSYLSQLFYLVHMLDWSSYYLAKDKGVDPVAITSIDFLKGELSKN